MIIREEKSGDRPGVRHTITAAFGRTAEADLADALRESGHAALSLVAEEAGSITGHVLFSKLQAPERCLSLAPVSVAPDRQNRGIGSTLIRNGLLRAEQNGWKAVFLLGEPGYYARFGFSCATAACFETPYPKCYFMALELSPHALGDRTGQVIYAPPFLALN